MEQKKEDPDKAGGIGCHIDLSVVYSGIGKVAG